MHSNGQITMARKTASLYNPAYAQVTKLIGHIVWICKTRLLQAMSVLLCKNLTFDSVRGNQTPLRITWQVTALRVLNTSVLKCCRAGYNPKSPTSQVNEVAIEITI